MQDFISSLESFIGFAAIIIFFSGIAGMLFQARLNTGEPDAGPCPGNNGGQPEKAKKEEGGYEKPSFKPLADGEIEAIHQRGHITPEEKVKEWESMGLCAPGDAIGGAAWRCKKFHGCHDCLVDYANAQGEYTSFYDAAKVCKPKLYGCGMVTITSESRKKCASALVGNTPKPADRKEPGHAAADVSITPESRKKCAKAMVR